MSYQHRVECEQLRHKLNAALQRAEAAEAIVSDVKEVIGLLTEREWAEHCTKTETGKLLEELITELHDDAYPASGLEELVPDEISPDDAVKILAERYGEFGIDHHLCCDSFEVGANWRRSQILRNIEEAK